MTQIEKNEKIAKINFNYEFADIDEMDDLELDSSLAWVNLDLKNISIDKNETITFKLKFNKQSLKEYQKYIYGWDQTTLLKSKDNEGVYLEQTITLPLSHIDGQDVLVQIDGYDLDNDYDEAKEIIQDFKKENKGFKNWKVYVESSSSGVCSNIVIYNIEKNNNKYYTPNDIYGCFESDEFHLDDPKSNIAITKKLK